MPSKIARLLARWSDSDSSDDEELEADMASAEAHAHDAEPTAPTRKRRAREAGRRDRRHGDDFATGDMRGRMLDPTTSPWWDLLHHPDTIHERTAKGIRFRRKFRLPLVIILYRGE